MRLRVAGLNPCAAAAKQSIGQSRKGLVGKLRTTMAISGPLPASGCSIVAAQSASVGLT